MRHRMKESAAVVMLIALVAASTGARAAARPADPVAVVVQVTGAVQIQRGGQGAQTAATVGANLEAGDRVIVGSGARAVLLYKTGKMEPATATLTVAAPATTQPAGRFQQTVTTLAQVATTNARSQPNRQGMIRPVAGEPLPISPRNDVNVLDVRPTFTWFRVADAAGYTVQVTRIEPSRSKPERFSAGRDTTWTYPEGSPPLIPGAVYEWTVGVDGGRIATVQRFRVVSAEVFTGIATLMRELTTAGIDPSTDGLFLTALAYRDAGLFYEADRALIKLGALGSGKGRAFHMLHGEVLDAIGRVEAAARHFAAADAEPGQE